jgi:hypothetical protein
MRLVKYNGGMILYNIITIIFTYYYLLRITFNNILY